ncbi:MAG TPA: penicillin-binding transpeptidase domain-containing protein [Symbiobacteriaceae bacterium]|nr:penicillin-binding transpeptidase domain-containing protein [Symbiobacteriaceae bacterium]
MGVQLGRRVVWLSVISLLLLAALGGRLYHLQVTKNVAYTRIAHDQRTLSLPLAPGRGLILDRNEEPLTDPHQSWQVAVFPALLDDAEAEARALSRILGVPAIELLADFPQKQPGWLRIGRELAEAEGLRVKEAGLSGIAAGPVLSRVGPDALARHLVGYTNVSGGARGLELAFDKELKGSDVPALTAWLDGRGQALEGLGIRTFVPTAGKVPYRVVTTIDQRFQEAVEEVLDSRKDDRPAAAVVMDPSTGEVLAMASRPDFAYGDDLQPNDPALKNRALEPQPPGSVFKAIIAAAALQAGKVKPDERFHCDGHADLNGWKVTDAGHGWLTFAEAMAKSCNIVFAQVGVGRLGVTPMREAAELFGFGAATGVLGRPWPEESEGFVPPVGSDNAVQMAIGQGDLRVTPLQIARAFSAIANGGALPPARLIKAVKSPAGEVIERPAAGRPQRVISKETAATVQDLLAGVTQPKGAGTGQLAWVAGAGSAGKTGSAETGGEQIHAWFAGYVPQWKPQWVIVVMVEDGKFGGQAAAPIFREIGQRLIATSGY